MYNPHLSDLLPPVPACPTLHTPDIVDSLVNMTAGSATVSPLDIYQQQQQQQGGLASAANSRCTAIAEGMETSASLGHPQQQQQQQQQFGSAVQLPQIMISEQSASSHSDSSAAVSPSDNEKSSGCQKTMSEIKNSLKHRIQSKHKNSLSESSGTDVGKSNRKDTINSNDTSEYDDDDDEDQKSPKNSLTPEDEERRRRRRERNKIAATKCRMKKREKQQNLQIEAEVLEKNNKSLKLEQQKLEEERRNLLEALNKHCNSCEFPGGYSVPEFPSFAQLRRNGCCTSTLNSTTIKTEPVTSTTPTSTRGRRGGSTRGRATGRGGRGGGGGAASRTKIKQEPVTSPVHVENTDILPRLMPSPLTPLAQFPAAQENLQSAPIMDYHHCLQDLQTSLEYCEESLMSTGNNTNMSLSNTTCANYQESNELSNGSNYPLQITGNFNNSPMVGVGPLRPSPLITEVTDYLGESSDQLFSNIMETQNIYMEMDSRVQDFGSNFFLEEQPSSLQPC